MINCVKIIDQVRSETAALQLAIVSNNTDEVHRLDQIISNLIENVVVYETEIREENQAIKRFLMDYLLPEDDRSQFQQQVVDKILSL